MTPDNKNKNNPARKKRCKWEIIHSILKAANDGCSTKTKLQHLAYIDWRSFKRYFELMLDNGFICHNSKSSDYYEITEKGKKFLEQLNNLEKELESNSEE